MTVRSIFQVGMLSIITALLPLMTQPGSGEEKRQPKAIFALGAMSIPEFEGSDDNEVIPLVLAKVNFGKYYIEARGLEVKANVSPFRHIEFGPSLSFRRTRDDSVTNESVRRLREVDDAVEVGGFVKIPFYGVLVRTDQLVFEMNLRTDLSDTHEGTLAMVSVTYGYSPTKKFRLNGSLRANYASDDFMETYFTVDAENSLLSGLTTYDAAGGLKDVDLALTGMYQFNSKWGVMGIVGYKKLLGDAADSSIVQEAGSEDQILFGFGISYRF